jgi:hypothetical protein
MRQEDHRVVGADAGKRTGQIVLAAEAVGPEPMGELVAQAREPEAAALRADQDGVDLQ